jgi:hypothetical protein
MRDHIENVVELILDYSDTETKMSDMTRDALHGMAAIEKELGFYRDEYGFLNKIGEEEE